MTDNTPTTGQAPDPRPRLERGCPIAVGDTVTGLYTAFERWSGVVREFYIGHRGFPFCRIDIGTGEPRNEVVWFLIPAEGVPSAEWQERMDVYRYAQEHTIPLALVPAHQDLAEQGRVLAVWSELLAARLNRAAAELREGTGPNSGLGVAADARDIDAGLARYLTAHRDFTRALRSNRD